jgi:hypothetical protein
MSNLFNLFWIFLILVSLQPVLQRQLLLRARTRVLSQIAHERGSAVEYVPSRPRPELPPVSRPHDW